MGRFGWNLSRPDPIVIDSSRKLNLLHDKMMQCDLIAIDTETTGLNYMTDVVVYWSISTGDDRYFLFRENLEDFKDIFDDSGKAWIGSQIKYDAHIMRNSGYPLAGDLMCTLTMDRLVYPDRLHGLKEAYAREFGERMASFAQTFGEKNKAGKYQVPKDRALHEILTEKYATEPEKVIDYASMDAWAVFRLFRTLKDQLKETETERGYTLWDVFLWCEVPFTRVLYNMEFNGFMIDMEYLQNLIEPMQEEIGAIEKELFRKAGYPLNLNSSVQLCKFFFSPPEEGGLGLKPIKMTDGGKSGIKKPSLKAEVMEQYAEDGVEEARIVVKHREMSKLLNSYVKNLIKFCTEDGRVHSLFQQFAVETARLSIKDPALQTLPRPRKEFDIRTAFIAPPGKKLVVSDYDQVEMYILGHMSKDEGLLKNIWDGKDIHTSNVELVWGEPYEAVAAAKKNKSGELTEREEFLLDLRQYVKIIGFGQPNSQAEVKPAQNGEIYWHKMPMTIPCCVAKRSVSTCGVCS